tara:strand:+ start:92577 stop:93311 length:735 start_codon:yes stop_codon:yes gene_type:complete
MKKIVSIVLVLLVITSCGVGNTRNSSLAKTNSIKEKEWKILFDGSSLDNFKEYLKDEVSDNWKIEDNAIVFHPPKERKRRETFNIVTKENFTDFVLSLEWRISEAGNSGIFWGVKEIEELTYPFETGPEIQVLDNEKHPDAKAGLSHQSGALYDLVDPVKDATKPVGEWNTYVITINHKINKGIVVLNGTKTVEFPLSGSEWDALIASSKFRDWEYFGKYPTGKIGFQDHGNMVAFRNIKIKEL